jgi:hypothetical protein
MDRSMIKERVQDPKNQEWDPRREAKRVILKILERDGDVG